MSLLFEALCDESLVSCGMLFSPPTLHNTCGYETGGSSDDTSHLKKNSYMTSKARCGLLFLLSHSSGYLKLKVSFPHIYSVLIVLCHNIKLC